MDTIIPQLTTITAPLLALYGLGHQVPLARPAPTPKRVTVLAGDLEHRPDLEQALGGERLLALAPGQDPITAISAWLQASPSDELHLVAHGAPGRLSLGLGIDRMALLQRAEQIGRWGVERIYLWSCRVGGDLSFVSALQELTGARVFSSAERLGLGKTLMGSSFPELAAGVAALPLPLELGVAPTAVDDSVVLSEDQAKQVDVLANDIDLDSAVLFVYAVTPESGNLGSVNLDPSGNVVYSAIGSFDSLAAGQTVSESFTYSVSDGSGGVDVGLVAVTITGVNDAPVLKTLVPLTIAEGGNDVSITIGAVASDIDNGDVIRFDEPKESASWIAGSNGGRFIVTPGGGEIHFNPGSDFEFLSAGQQLTSSYTFSVKDLYAAIVPGQLDVVVTGVNDAATITAGGLDSEAAGDTASTILLSEGAALGGKTAADAFAISDVDYGEQEFKTAQQTVNILANAAGSYQGGGTGNRVVGSFSLDASAATNDVDAGAVTGQTADLTISDLGGADGFDSLAEGETATASITLTSEDGTATAVSNLTITGVNDAATITAAGFESEAAGDKASTILLSEGTAVGGKTAADAFAISDVDYGEQEFQASSVMQTVEIVANAAGANQSGGMANRVVGSFSLDASEATNTVDAGAVTGQTADLTISDLGGADGFESLAEGETATASFTLTSEDGTAEAVSNLTITGVNDAATITAAGFESEAAGDKASTILLSEGAAVGGKTAADAFSISDVDYGEQEFQASSVKQTVEILADAAGANQSGGMANRVVGSFSLDASAATNDVDAGAVTGQTADLTISDLGGADGFDSLAEGETATASITLTSEDGTAEAVSNLTITGVNDAATITAAGFESEAVGDKASTILLSEGTALGGKTAADAFAISDVDYGEQEFQASSVKQTVEIFANAAGSYQVGGTANRVVGSFSLDASAATNDVDAGAVTGQTADLTISDLGGADGFDSLAEGETATASITLTSEDGTATAVSNLTITGVNDAATITAAGFDSEAAGDKASTILLSEGTALGGKTAADAFAISDVDYGEQEFQASSVTQTVEILANAAGTNQSGGMANRVVGSFSLDASGITNMVDAGAITGQTADLGITDLGGANGFDSLAAGETATASITLTSEDGTATAVSNLTITGVNDDATITTTSFKTDYQQSDFTASAQKTYANSYQVGDVDYGQQEFGSGKYTANIVVNGSSGRTDALGAFSVVSDGSNRSAGSTVRDAGSVNDDSADVVIHVDPTVQQGQVFNLGLVLDSIAGNSYGVQLNNVLNGGKGSNNVYDLSDLSVSGSTYGHLEAYRYVYEDGKVVDGRWGVDTSPISLTDPIRLIGGINSLAHGETASATLSVASEDGTAISAPVTMSVVGANDAPVVDTSKQLRSFELYGTFTVAEMLGFVDPSKTLITDVDYGSLPESIAITKLTPTGSFADADTGTLQRYNEATDEWVDVDTKNVSDTNKLLLRPSDVLRFNANAEAYVSAVLDKGKSDGGGIFDVEFRAWDSAYDDALGDSPSSSADLSTLFSSGLQTISLALATSGERANLTDLTYIPGQAIGIDGSNITIDGDLNIQTPVKGSVAGAGSSVYDNAVALVDGTSFGGIHGVGNANNITAAGDTVINAQAEGLVSVDASNYFDSFDDATDADATARLGIKSGPVGSGLVANGAFGVRDVDLEVGANLDLTGVVLGKTLATSRSMDGRAHAGSQFSSSSGLANTEVDVAGDMTLAANGGILTTVEAFSRNGSALADSTAAAAYGVVSGLKGSDTRFDVGGDFEGQAGLEVTIKTKASMVGDGVDNVNGFSFKDEVIADSKIGNSFGFGTLSGSLADLKLDAKDALALSVDNHSLLDTQALAVTGDATAKGQITGNTGIYRADLQSGGAGDVDVSVHGVVKTLAQTTTGDVFAKGYGLHSVGIESSDFDFKDPQSSLSVDVRNAIDARALTKQGGATSLIASSSAGMLGAGGDDVVQGVERVNVLVQDQGFSQAAGISGTGASASAQQSATGISGYVFATDEAMVMQVGNALESQSNASIVQWA